MVNLEYADEDEVTEQLEQMLLDQKPVTIIQLLADAMAELADTVEVENAHAAQELGKASQLLAEVVLDLGDEIE